MKLGTLSLFQKRGLFYKELEISSEDSYAGLEASSLKPDFLEQIRYDLPWKSEVTSVDEKGNTDFIKAIFEDEGNASYPYEVTVWLLVEEIEV